MTKEVVEAMDSGLIVMHLKSVFLRRKVSGGGGDDRGG